MAIAFESEKVMFEIYRDPIYSGHYRVVYFTELNDHNRELAFNEALRGEHFFDGFIANYRKEEAKQIIAGLLEQLNRGDALSQQDFSLALREFMP